MREVDRLTTERYGIPSIILMENAAHAVARVITEKLGGSVKDKSILILCGKGNNGGDGAALARILWQQGGRCLVALLGTVEETKGDARTNFDIVKQIGVTQSGYFNLSEDYLRLVQITADEQLRDLFSSVEEDACVDALLGTGFSGPLREAYAGAVRKLNNVNYLGRRSLIVSVDLPSGVNSNVAELDVDVRDELVESHMRADVALPDVTVTFTAPKVGNVLPPASRTSKELVVANIGSPSGLIDEVASKLFLAEPSDPRKWVRSTRFGANSYKNKRGHALVIAGSETYSGAAVLAGNSASRSGVGLVTLACPAEAKTEIASRILPEVILSTIGSPEFDELSSKSNAIAVGPGLSATDPEIESLVRKIVEERTTPVIVDAGALSYFDPPVGLPRRHADEVVRVPLIVTPHEGEFMRLLGTDDKEAIKDRVAAVREFSEKNNVILVLKGERVLIGHPDGRVVVNPTGNSGLGKAGNGDTLTGILAGFCAQAAAMDIDIFETVVAAVYIAGTAGDIAEKKYGKRVMTASDVRECLAEAFKTIEDTVS